jgi:hypothetical protein
VDGKEVTQVDEASKAPVDETLYVMYRDHEYCEDGLRAVYNAGVESLALENARLKAELESSKVDAANTEIVLNEVYVERDVERSLREELESDNAQLRASFDSKALECCRLMGKLELATGMLNKANARITALVDAAEEARHEAIERGEAAEMREDRGY